MNISFRCGRCQSQLSAPESAGGKGVRCPNCDTVQRVPGGDAPTAAPLPRRRGEDEDPDDRRPLSPWEEGAEERPRRPPRREEEDDRDDDRPVRSRRRRKNGSIPAWFWASGGGLLLVGTVVILIIALRAGGRGGASGPPPALAMPDLVAFWSFDEGVGDTASDAKTRAAGKLHGARWVPGVRGRALEFDGRADWFDFTSNAPMSFGDNEPFTVCCWVKPRSRVGPVFSFRGPKHPRIDTATILGLWVENGRLCAWARKDGSVMFPNEQFGAEELTPDEWHHVAVVRHPGGMVDLYQDGRLATRRLSRESDGAFTLTFGTLGWERFPHHRVGEFDDPTIKYFAGVIDEFAVFSRALDDAELTRLARR